MINIHTNVSGTPTDHPIIRVDSGVAADGYMSRPGRCTFALPDGTPPHGALVTWQGGAKSARTVIAQTAGVPLEPGDYEGGQLLEPIPTLDYGPPAPPPVATITTQGEHFMANGQRWIAKLHSDFRYFKRWLDGEDLHALEQQRKDCGSDGPRVFGSCDFLFKLDPRSTPNYYGRLTDFAKYQADRGASWEYVAYTDRQMTGLGDDHWPRACEALAGQPGLVVQLCNEFFKNGVDPRQFAPIPNGCPQSPGSFIDGMGPPSPAWTAQPNTYNAFNPSRNWKWPVTVGVTSWELRTYNGGLVPLLIDEPIGAGEHDEPGRRATDPVLFEKMAVDCALWAAGGCFHAQSGLQSELWGPIQTACAEHFFRGLGR